MSATRRVSSSAKKTAAPGPSNPQMPHVRNVGDRHRALRPRKQRHGHRYPRSSVRHGRRRFGLSPFTGEVQRAFLPVSGQETEAFAACEDARRKLRARAGGADPGVRAAQAVVLAQDAVYDEGGKADWRRTHFYVPNDYLFQVVARYPELMIPCVSINPQRADGIDELDRSAAKGARVLKIHPPTQNVDLADKKYAAFFRRCAALEMVVMVHTGHEHTAPIVDVRLASPRKLAAALDEGCTVVACHCGTGWWWDQPDMLPDFFLMLRKHTNLWGDTAILGSAGRSRDFRTAAGRPRSLGSPAARQRFSLPPVPAGVCPGVRPKAGDRLATGPQLDGAGFGFKRGVGIGLDSAEQRNVSFAGKRGQRHFTSGKYI